MSEVFKASKGIAYPFGVRKHLNGFNFALFSKNATRVSLCLFQPEDPLPFCEISLDPETNKTGYVWHIYIYDLSPNLHYGYRLDGPTDPKKGLRYDWNCIVVDPLAKMICSSNKWGEGKFPDLQLQNGEFTSIQRAIVYPIENFEWENDRLPNIAINDLIIYEMHVRGFTQDPSSKVKYPGTFLGMIEKIPYLKWLGVNAVELLPIFEFNEMEVHRLNPITNEPLCNFWGYSTINFFSLMNRFGTGSQSVINEFKTLVKALHANGIEVILDVVYNHTAEGNGDGPILSFKGIENSTYYILAPNGDYYNFSGCGNTFNCNHPIVRRFIQESLRYWVTEMHIDGFRFDLASILTRGMDGGPVSNPPIVEEMAFDPVLANVKLIAEAWDAGGLYQVGTFPSHKIWAEWNGKYRDTVRSFIKGTDNQVGFFATRLCGSEDLYGHDRTPGHSINFITAHDGFTLADLVAYNEKHNIENGENNNDGFNDNESWNCGIEGPTKDRKILNLRMKQMKNFVVALMVSQGVPMIWMGDEYGHTKNGNNNTWCHDNPINWFQWDKLEENQEFVRFFRMLILFRKEHPIFHRPTFLKHGDINWHGLEPYHPDWNPESRFIAFSVADPQSGYDLYVAFNASDEPLLIHLPRKSGKEAWYKIVDTAKPSPEDIVEGPDFTLIVRTKFTIQPFSSIILKCRYDAKPR